MVGNLSISEVVHMVGFASQSHLTRHVRKAFGVTPGALVPKRKNRWWNNPAGASQFSFANLVPPLHGTATEATCFVSKRVP
ncbi:hypothetical protein A9Q02_16405 [Candidatus Chloroploca asiatica]|uniref:HTH araC/xylS-type domain-containing protein n=1 Tax=Candidatus Chloroploca asiatica TaxID=1506545 RepID=A0A2H3KSJ4_9CHLR|nr:hypothetical protein A9Q02_16405 [Candidatus Chloroploca asiatica]